MQRTIATTGFASLRSRIMLACALVMAGALATPVAHAGGYQGSGGDDSAEMLGALVVGAVIGGVLVAASQDHHDNDYRGGYYPSTYRRPVYYGGPPPYPPPGYAYGQRGYGNPRYGYRNGVSVGIVYRGSGSHYYGNARPGPRYGNRYYHDGYRRYGNGANGYYVDHRGNQQQRYDDRYRRYDARGRGNGQYYGHYGH